MKTYAEKRFFKWELDDVSVSLRAKSGSYGGGSEVLVVQMVLASIAPNAERTDGTISPTIMHRAGTGGQLPILIMREADDETCGKESTETSPEPSTPNTTVDVAVGGGVNERWFIG